MTPPSVAEFERIGWIGLGRMGEPMASQLLGGSSALTVYNRSPEKAAGMLAKGAELAPTVARLAARSQIVFSMIQDDPALRQVALGPAGVLENLEAGSIYVDMSTVTPTASAEVAEAAALHGIGYLRAPVSGSTGNARAATLTIFASGAAGAFEAARPLLERIGSKVFHVGDAEQARYLKLAINLMAGATACMLAEALVLGEKGGVDWDQMLDIVRASVVGSPIIGYKVEPLKKRDYTPAFTARQMAKDFDYILQVARDTGTPVPIASLVRQSWSAMQGTDRGEYDLFGYVELLEQLAGIPFPGGGAAPRPQPVPAQPLAGDPAEVKASGAPGRS